MCCFTTCIPQGGVLMLLCSMGKNGIYVLRSLGSSLRRCVRKDAEQRSAEFRVLGFFWQKRQKLLNAVCKCCPLSADKEENHTGWWSWTLSECRQEESHMGLLNLVWVQARRKPYGLMKMLSKATYVLTAECKRQTKATSSDDVNCGEPRLSLDVIGHPLID